MKIKNNKFDTFANISSLMILICTSLYLLIFWNRIPEEIPSHYNGAGVADIISSKTSLVFPLVVGWVLLIGLTGVEGYPQIWNTGVTITESNRERVYRTLKSMLMTMKMILVVAISYIIINSSLGLNLSSYFLPVLLLLIFGTLIFFQIKMLRAK